MFTIDVDEMGWFRIRSNDNVGRWTDYRSVATLETDTGNYIAFSEYGLGDPVLEPLTVYEVGPAHETKLKVV